MAISQTMSNSTDWLLPPYQPDFSIAASPAAPIEARATTTRNNHLIPADHGRISKPIRRRSRASRRTPTTLFNTDATNFRAMVQQFTGGPAARFAATSHLPSGGSMLGFTQPTSAPVVASGFHVQYPNELQHVYGMDGANRGGFPAAAAAEEMNRSDYGNFMMLR